MAPTIKKAWAAGILDGEGYIAKEKNRNTTRTTVRVDNTNRLMLEELSKYFGGNIYLNKRKNRPKSKPCWYWRLTCKKAEGFLKEVLPYLVVKKQVTTNILT